MPFSAAWVTDDWWEFKESALLGTSPEEWTIHTCPEVPTGEPNFGCRHGAVETVVERKQCRCWIAKGTAVHFFGPFTPDGAVEVLRRIQEFLAKK